MRRTGGFRYPPQSLLLWEKVPSKCEADEEFLCVMDTSSVGFAATCPYWGRLIAAGHPSRRHLPRYFSKTVLIFLLYYDIIHFEFLFCNHR